MSSYKPFINRFDVAEVAKAVPAETLDHSQKSQIAKIATASDNKIIWLDDYRQKEE